jgi:hypothetical protein
MRLRRARIRWFVVMAALAIATPVLATTSGPAAGTPAIGPLAPVETQISATDNTTTQGEPEIAENPLNPNNLFIDWNSFRYPTSNMTPITNPCGGKRSMDGGLSWQSAPVPLSSCADGVTTFGPDGTLYAGGITVTNTQIFPPPCSNHPGSILFANLCLLVTGYDALVRSTDSGQNWSPVARPMGSQSVGPFPFAPGSGNPAGTFDRPWVRVDQPTNTVYASGANIADHERFVTASTDDGQSFGTIYAVDSPDYPSGGNPSGTIDAANGVLAVAYTAASAPNATCPCVIFETSTDQGATFTRHVVPTVDAASVPRPFVTADPNQPGHFALAILDSTGTENQVYTTRDGGATWHGPTLVAEAPANLRFKPWIAFGPSGQLALVWRTAHGGSPATSPYDVWAAVGRDLGNNGAAFSAPVRVSSATGTYPPGSGGQGDDFSFVLADHKYIHVGWGDSRSGFTQVWYSRIPFPTFAGFNNGTG